MAAVSFLDPDSNEADPSLCQQCQAFDIQAFSTNTIPWRGYRISDIANSAASGCPFCSYLASGLDDVGIQVYARKQNKSLLDRWVHFKVLRAVDDSTSQGDGLKITYLRVYTWNGVGYTPVYGDPLLEFHVVADPDDPASKSGDVVGRYAIRNPSSTELMDVIKSWLATCEEEHPQCSQTLSGQRITTPTPLPTRCLQVAEDKDIVGGICISLVETSGRTGTYTTLSHRWPKELYGATTSKNIAERLKSADSLESVLPRHFVDACMLTLRLGYKYVWIDAVCIVQGSMADWAHEAARMASYYQNSKLTIAVTHGDGTTGLFKAETAENSRPLIRLPYRAKSDSIASQPSFFYLVPSDCYYNNDYHDYVASSDLLTRGWVTQEWVLSRRILCYTPNTVYYQCMEEFPHNEDGRIRSMRKTDDGHGYVVRLDRLRASDLELKNLNLEFKGQRIYGLWYSVVEAYSNRNLTRPETDKLMGIVGIAEEFGRALVKQLQLTDVKSRVWVAGLWLEDIHRGLLWEQLGRLKSSASSSSPDRHDSGRIFEFPSWSWASRICSVTWTEFPSWGFHKSCEIRKVLATRDIQQERQSEIATPMTAEEANSPWELLPALSYEPDQALLVNPTKTFPVLCLRAKLINLLLREVFVEGDERQIVSVLSDHYASGFWRKIATTSSPQVICGWISLDKEQNTHLVDDRDEAPRDYVLDTHDSADGSLIIADTDHQADTVMYDSQERLIPERNDIDGVELGNREEESRQQTALENTDSAREVQVLLVNSYYNDRGGYPLGYNSLCHPVYAVLCLQKCSEGSVTTNAFERIGCGRLFGKDIQRLFENTEPQELELL